MVNSVLSQSESSIIEQMCFTLQLARNINIHDSVLLSNSLIKVPVEHRERLFNDLYFLLIFLEKPEILNELGEIKNINIRWKQLGSQKYMVIGHEFQYFSGEKIDFSLILEKQNRAFQYSSKSDFPEKMTFNEDDPRFIVGFGIVSVGEIIHQIMSTLSQATLMKIVSYDIQNDLLVQKKYYYISLSKEAIQFLTDKTVIEKLLFEDERYYIRAACLKAITDQSLIAKVAKIDKSSVVRTTALLLLKDQSLALKIALETCSEKELHSLIFFLTDTDVLQKWLDESKDESIRSDIRARLSSPEIKSLQKK